MGSNRTETKQREYLIGDMSEIVGVSRDTLRFYEKKGIIKARKKENGYRYYLEEDILRLMFIVYRRKMNDSLEEIEDYIKGQNSVEYMKKHLTMRIKQEEAKIHYHQQAIARMQLAARDMDQAEKYEGKCSFKNFPLAYKLGVCKSLHESLKQWFALSSAIGGLDMTYFYTEFSMGKSGLLERETKLLLYKVVEPWIGKEFRPEQYKITEPVPCIYTIVESESIYPDEETAWRMYNWGRSQGVEPEQTFYVNNMTAFLGEESDIHFLELYMPIKEKDKTGKIRKSLKGNLPKSPECG